MIFSGFTPENFCQRPDHGVERIGDADDEGVGSILLDALAHRRHDFEIDADQIVAAHAWLPRHAGGDDHHIGTLDVGVIVGAFQLRIEAFDRAGLGQVQRLALGQAFGDVEHHHVTKFLERHQMGERAANLSAADKSYFLARHGMILCPEKI